MELTITGLNKTQGKHVAKVQDMLQKFINMFQRTRDAKPESIAIHHGTYSDIMGYYPTRPDKLTFRGILIYNANYPPEKSNE